MALISLRVSDELAVEFSAFAATQGGKSALLRRLIADALAAPAPRILAFPVGRPEKVTVRFRESEMRQLAEVSHQRGMTRTGWIVALVRSRLGSPVQHSPNEHDVLRAIVREAQPDRGQHQPDRASRKHECAAGVGRLSPICQ
ncbi:plasmid mobilization relaxosome protein MobC (plasmid) [Bradyrhizobium guangxiense]